MKYCKHCGKEVTRKSNDFCNSFCHAEYKKQETINDFLKNQSTVTKLQKPIIRYIKQLNNNACSLCGWDKLHPSDNSPLVQLDHIDGNSANNNISNLRVLCPNCHSMTPTYGARNKMSSRKNRQVSTRELKECIHCGVLCKNSKFCSQTCYTEYKKLSYPSLEHIINIIKSNNGIMTKSAIQLNLSDNGLRKILKRNNIDWKKLNGCDNPT